MCSSRCVPLLWSLSLDYLKGLVGRGSKPVPLFACVNLFVISLRGCWNVPCTMKCYLCYSTSICLSPAFICCFNDLIDCPLGDWGPGLLSSQQGQHTQSVLLYLIVARQTDFVYHISIIFFYLSTPKMPPWKLKNENSTNTEHWITRSKGKQNDYSFECLPLICLYKCFFPSCCSTTRVCLMSQIFSSMYSLVNFTALCSGLLVVWKKDIWRHLHVFFPPDIVLTFYFPDDKSIMKRMVQSNAETICD